MIRWLWPVMVSGVLAMSPPVLSKARGAEASDAGTGQDAASEQALIRRGCDAMAGVLGSVDMNDCLNIGLKPSGAFTVQGRPILVREYPPLAPREPQARVLLVGGIHGDEYSSFSVVFRWLEVLNEHHSGLFHWRVIPGLNLDGLNAGPAERMNANGIDLNRNFPTPNWHENKQEYWVEFTGRDPRRYPGEAPLSEPESQYLFDEIERFKPDAIVSLHAPYGILDFDGPKNPPHHLGYLYLNRLGTYPGSLGNFAGVQRKLPVITMELPHAGIMPTREQSSQVWNDLIYWLKRNVQRQERREPEQKSDQVADNSGITPAYLSGDSASCMTCQPESSLRQNCCRRDSESWNLLVVE